jgi:hypothetical protein
MRVVFVGLGLETGVSGGIRGMRTAILVGIILFSCACSDTPASGATDSSGDAANTGDTAADVVPDEVTKSSTVVINEVLASNDTGLVDEVGDNEDWLELYNASAEPVDISGWMLSDSLAEDGVELSWVLPDSTTIEAGGYLLVWADKDEEDGPLHADFKLSKDGETVSLLSPNGVVVDEVTFPTLAADVSYGRSPDGSDNWVEFSAPTPNATNAGP